jgi:hypothetical protein
VKHEVTEHGTRWSASSTLAAWLCAERSFAGAADGVPSNQDVPTSEDEWAAWAQAVAGAGLAGLMRERFAGHPQGPPWPAMVEEYLARASRLIAAQNLHLHGALERVLHALAEMDVRVVLLKGAALHCGVYERPDLRPMSDVDLLVHARDLTRARTALGKCGCRPGFSLVREDFFPTYYYEQEYETAGNRPVRIDLHVRPFRPLRYARLMPEDALWEDALSVEIGSAPALIPRAEMLLLHLAGHAAFHGCRRLLWLYDMVRLVECWGDRVDWSAFLRGAKLWSLSAAVGEALHRTKTLLGWPGPPEVLEELSEQPHPWADRLILRTTPDDAQAPVRHVAVEALTTPDWGMRLGYLRAYLMPSRSHLRGVYPYRHAGWPIAAHLWRFGRLLTRSLSRKDQRTER